MFYRCLAAAAFFAISVAPLGTFAENTTYTLIVPFAAKSLPWVSPSGVPLTWLIACSIGTGDPKAKFGGLIGFGSATVGLDSHGTFEGTTITVKVAKMSVASGGIVGTRYECGLNAYDPNQKLVPNMYTGTGTVSGTGNFP
jgi:hypothetical protein